MFLLIGHSNRVRRSEAISIHLMFLLISGQRMHYRIKSNYFNTSHVSINRKSGGQDHSRRNFNTSHVSINHRFFKADCSILYISIHLMFLLIVCRGHSAVRSGSISIHLMFLLILEQVFKIIRKLIFQYISCFY